LRYRVKRNFFKSQNFVSIDLADILGFPIGCNIYNLWDIMKKDRFETDVIDIIKERNRKGAELLTNDVARKISEIYLFFDYDPQEGKTHGSKIIEKLLERFDNATELGKLYINYPMVESIRDIKKENLCHERCYVDIADTKTYKECIGKSGNFSDYRKYSLSLWKHFCQHAAKKANCIVNFEYTLPSYDVFISNLTQGNIFSKQKDSHIKNDRICVLNGIQLFLLDFFGEVRWSELLEATEEYKTMSCHVSNCPFQQKQT
jgi:hypothetical protein